MARVAEETGDHLLKSASSMSNFRWIWVVFENPIGGLLYCFGFIRKDLWFVTCDDPINVFWGTAIVFFQHFFTPIDTNLFLSDCQIVRDPTRTSLFTAMCSCKIECMMVEDMPKKASISRYVAWWSCIINSRTASMFFGTKAVLGEPSRISSSSEIRPPLN